MAKESKKKRIIITNKGFFYTSRGQCRTPFNRPYMEYVDVIFKLIARGAHVVEILEDGTKIPLTAQNFDQDNTTEKNTQTGSSPLDHQNKDEEKNNESQKNEKTENQEQKPISTNNEVTKQNQQQSPTQNNQPTKPQNTQGGNNKPQQNQQNDAQKTVNNSKKPEVVSDANKDKQTEIPSGAIEEQ